METINSIQNFDTTWIENLAIEELNMEETGIVHIDEHLNPALYLEESSIKLMDQIRQNFDLYISKFNEYRNSSASLIKVFKISNTVNDFMLFRNSLRLVVARKSNDVISIGLLTGSKDIISPRLPDSLNQKPLSSLSRGHELKAHLGPFNKIMWKFQGEDIDAEVMARFYLTEFIRNSSR